MSPASAGAAGLLALALLVTGGAGSRERLRGLHRPPVREDVPAPALRPGWVLVGAVAVGMLGWALGGPVTGVLAGGATGAAGTVTVRRAARVNGPEDTSTDLAGRWELLAVCLTAGLPVASAVAAAAAPLTGTAGTQLRRVAAALELGADPHDAWRSVAEVPALAAFARAAGRSSGTGSALAQVARTEGDRIRAEMIDTAQARAQRAAVLITGPLGLCFLPAFLVLGIAPVVIGLAGEALAQW